MLLSRSLHAAPPVPRGQGGRGGLAPPSLLSVLVSLQRLKYGCSHSLCGDECHRRHHLHRHIHWRVAPPISRFPRVQVAPFFPYDLSHHSCQAILSPRVVLVVACLLADASCQLRFLPRLYTNPLGCVDSFTSSLEGVGTLVPGSIRS